MMDYRKMDIAVLQKAAADLASAFDDPEEMLKLVSCIQGRVVSLRADAKRRIAAAEQAA